MNTHLFPIRSQSFADELLKRTTSRCPVCHAACPAEVWRTGGIPSRVLLKRTCPAHGEASVCIASDARFYWLAKGKDANDACCPPSRSTLNPQLSTNSCCSADGSNPGTLGRNASPGDALGVQEKLSTCLALIEIVNSCNLACPTCYADSPVGTGARVDAVPLADLQRRIQGVIDRKGPIEILQLSGGEPTLHPEFFALLRWLHANPGVDYVLLNTNGVRLAQDEAFARELGATFRYGKFQLYLQFDGVQAEAQHALRGADLRAMRERCLERCRELNVPVTLAMTVNAENLPHLWDAIAFGLRWRNVRGISFQPVFTSGRIVQPSKVQGPKSKVEMHADRAPNDASVKAQTAGSGNTPHPACGHPLPSSDEGRGQGEGCASPDHASVADASRSYDLGHRTLDFGLRRLNTADIILAAVAQSGGKLRFEDFTPLPCGDPNCATIGYLLKLDGQVRSVSDFIDFKNVQGFLTDKVHYKLEDLLRCGCESEPLGALLKEFELDETHTFRLFIKPFMDAATWDEDRIDRCCTHVIRPDGKLDSFCRYYSGFADAKGAA